MHNYLILLLLTTVASLSRGIEIQPLRDLEGLRFEEIGELKLIIKYKTLNFHINVTSLETVMCNATEYLGLIEKNYENDVEKLNDIERLKTNLELRRIELNDILYGLIDSTTVEKPLVRNKRNVFGLFDGLSNEDGRKIEKDLIQLKDKINEIIDVNGGLRNYLSNVTDLLNGTIEDLGRRVALAKAIAILDEVERKVNSIIMLLTKERLSGDIITIPEFQRSIGSIRRNLTVSEDLPYHKMAEYYYHLRVTHVIDNSVIKLEMDVPIIEKSSRKLYKIVELPARNESNLILIDAEWKYIAININESTTMMSLDSCYKPSKSMYYCEIQSPLKSIDSHDCMTNALVKRKIDIKLCKTTVVKSSNLTFIRLNDGQYFYFAPTNETLTVQCRAETTVLNLRAQEIGILKLESGCRAVSSIFTLIKTVKYQEAPYEKQNILSVSFDIDQVKENIKSHNTPIVDKFYVESLSSLREMTVVIPDVTKIDKLHFAASYGNSEILMYLLMVLLVIFVIHIMYRTYMWFLQSCKCLQPVNKETNEKPGKTAYIV